jgi:thiosulfate/3-mercaptopyruvate sulfurtransferase
MQFPDKSTDQFLEYLVSSKWLDEHLEDSDLVVLDCTNHAAPRTIKEGYVTVSGRESWGQEHIPGSNHADFSSNLSGDKTHYRNALPSPEQFVSAMGALGIGDDSRVVLYDKTNSMWAARVWWMLRWAGFDNAAVLDGGYRDWKLQGRRVSTTFPCTNQQILTLHSRPELFVTKEIVMSSLGDRSTCLIDALSEAQFNGKESDLGLSGHIPGAINIPATSLLEPEPGQYLSDKQLIKILPHNQYERTIIYCGSGIAAASNALIMSRLGYENVSIYMPGLQEWIQDDSAPLVNRSS